MTDADKREQRRSRGGGLGDRVPPAPPQISVPGLSNHVTLPNLLAASKYRVLVSAVYGAGESRTVSAIGHTGEWAPRPPGPTRAPDPHTQPGPRQDPRCSQASARTPDPARPQPGLRPSYPTRPPPGPQPSHPAKPQPRPQTQAGPSHHPRPSQAPARPPTLTPSQAPAKTPDSHTQPGPWEPRTRGPPCWSPAPGCAEHCRTNRRAVRVLMEPAPIGQRKHQPRG